MSIACATNLTTVSLRSRGKNIFYSFNLGFSSHSLTKYDEYTSILRLLQSSADHLGDEVPFDWLVIPIVLQRRKWNADVGPKHIELILNHIRFIIDCGFDINWTAGGETQPLVHGCLMVCIAYICESIAVRPTNIA